MRLPGLLALLLVACRHVPPRAECASHQGTAWRELQTEHFLLSTNLDAEAARASVLELERNRKVLLDVFGQRVRPPGQVEVVVLQSHEQLTEFAQDSVSAYFSLTGDGPLLVFGAESYASEAAPARRVVLHELAHHISRYELLRQPRWFAEGLAGYLETLRPYGEKGDLAMGEVDSRKLAFLLRRPPLPLQVLWAWDDAGDLSAEALQHRYASAWLWTHFLLNRHAERFSRFQAGLARAVEPRAAWAEAFHGVTEATLESDLAEYARHGAYGMRSFKAEETQVTHRERMLSDAEVHVLRSRLFLRSPPRVGAGPLASARRELDAAEQRDASSFAVKAARYETLEQAPEQLASARALTVAHPEEGGAWRRLNEQLVNAGGPPAEIKAAAVKALQWSASDPRALNNLAWVYLSDGKAPTAIPLVTKAVKLAPWNAAYLDTLASALARVGRCSDAVAVERRALDVMAERGTPAFIDGVKARISGYEKGCQ